MNCVHCGKPVIIQAAYLDKPNRLTVQCSDGDCPLSTQIAIEDYPPTQEMIDGLIRCAARIEAGRQKEVRS
jgi:hypothetical protein